MIRDNLHTFHLKITTLSPLHIGTGEVYEPTSFVIDEGKLYEFDEIQFYQNLTLSDKKIFGQKVNNWMGIIDFYRSKAKEAKSIARFKCKASKEVEDTYKKLKNQDGSKKQNQFQIARTLKNPNTHKAIIPGSSIKGMLDTVLGIDNQKINSNEPRQRLILSDALSLEGSTEIGYAYRQHKNPERTAKSEIPQMLEIISRGSTFMFDMSTEYDFCEILQKMQAYHNERDDSLYMQTDNSFIARIGKFSGKAYMVRNGKNVLNSDGDPVATHTLYQKRDSFGWIKIELIGDNGCNKEDQNKGMIQTLEAFEQRIQSALSGKGIKRVYTMQKLPEQTNQSKEIIQHILKENNITIDDNGIIDILDVKMIIESLLEKYKGIRVSKLAAKMKVSVEEILSFALEESIDIEDANSFVSLEIAESIRTYL